MDRDCGVTKWDCLLIAGIVVFSLCWWLLGPGRGEGPATVRVYAVSGLFAEAPSDRDAVMNVPGPLGTSVVEIRRGRARIASSPCPDRLCVRMGWISRPGESVVCIPNRVSVSIGPGKGAFDAVTY